MRAAVYHRYGPPEVVRIEDVEKPVPEEDEVLVRVFASTVCAADWRLRKPDPPPVGWIMNGFPRPRKIHVLGMEFAGEVESTGVSVTRFKPGDRVFGMTGFRFGAHAEYICQSQDRGLAAMPSNASYSEAAAISFGGISALDFLQRAGIAAGQDVLVYGASGCVGTAAVQIAKHFGAHVTGVCSTANLDLVRSIGADDVVDYTSDDYTDAGRIYDIVHDTVGKGGFFRSLRVLKRGGTLIEPGPGIETLLGGPLARVTIGGKVIGGVARGGVAALETLRDLVEKGEFRPVIDREFPLEAIAEAHRHAQGGHKKGNVVIDIS